MILEEAVTHQGTQPVLLYCLFATCCILTNLSPCIWYMHFLDGRCTLNIPLGLSLPKRVPCPPASSSTATSPLAIFSKPVNHRITGYNMLLALTLEHRSSYKHVFVVVAVINDNMLLVYSSTYLYPCSERAPPLWI